MGSSNISLRRNMSRNKEIDTKNIFVVILFLITTILMVYPLLRTGNMLAFSDWIFHSSRSYQIYQNIKRGTFLTYIATDTFQHTGVGNFLFYPTLYLYPWSLLQLFLKPVTAYYVWYAGIIFTGLLVSYFSMLAICKDKIISYVFSFLFIVSNYHIGIGNYRLAEFIAIIFFPIVFFGLYNIFFRDANKWWLLSIGVSLIFYAHILSVIITLEVIVTFTLLVLAIKKEFKKVFIGLLKSVCLTLLLVLPVMCQFLTDYIGKSVSSAQPGVAISLTPSLQTILQNSLSNSGGDSIGLILLLLSMYIFVKIDVYVKENKKLVLFYVIAILFLLVSTTVFPWEVYGKTIIGVIQIPPRYLGYVTLFLSISGSYVVGKLYRKLKLSSVMWSGAFLIFISIIFIFNYQSMNRNTFVATSGADPNYIVLNKTNVTDGTEDLPQALVNDNNYKYLWDYRVLYGELDYWPMKSRLSTGVVDYNDRNLSIIKGYVYVNKKRENAIRKYSANQIDYKVRLSNNSTVDLPTLVYSGTYVKVNGEERAFELSNRGTPTLKLPQGNYNISVGYKPTLQFYLSILVTVATVLLLLIRGIYQKIRKKEIDHEILCNRSGRATRS
ncbi:hypothetical protein L1O48_09375 [Ligilactobacillus equi]|uniref:hypothetical protein n=1 Tax=Ligilactobacillus equi TaxID=137357 RepID=UPI002ED0441B